MNTANSNLKNILGCEKHFISAWDKREGKICSNETCCTCVYILPTLLPLAKLRGHLQSTTLTWEIYSWVSSGQNRTIITFLDSQCPLLHSLSHPWVNNNKTQQIDLEKSLPECWYGHCHYKEVLWWGDWPWKSSALFLALQINLCSKVTDYNKANKALFHLS